MLANLPYLEQVCHVFAACVLGGRTVGGTGSSRLYRVCQDDAVEKHCVLFRGRLKSVADVLKGIRSLLFTQSRWDALLRYWGAVCR